MTLKFRRFLYITFILLFLIIAPLIALYGAGYDLNLKNIGLQKTGIFILDSDPDGARITIKSELNNFNLSTIFSKIFNKSENIYTPAKIKKMVPGEYTIHIEKPGYWPWEKKLSIFPGESTFAENIKLFKNDSQVLASAGQINNTVLSHDGNFMLLDRGRDAILISVNDANELWPTVKNDLGTLPAWSPDDQRILIGNKIFDTNDLLADSTAAPRVDLSGFISTSSKAIKWGNGNKIYYLIDKLKKDKQKNADLILVSVDARTSRTIFSDKMISDYMLSGNQLITIEKNNRASSLDIYDSNNYKLTRTINLPAGDYYFKKPYNNYIVLSDANRNVFIIDPAADESAVLKKKIGNCNSLIWINKEKIIFSGDFEIWQLDLSTDQQNIITRISAEISDIFILPSQDYIIYATKNNIYALELDERDRRNLTKLVEMENIKFPILNFAGDTLYFYSTADQQPGYYKLQIR
jgi:hypothetical protein